MDTDCIFCKIVAGDIPSYQVYEDEHVVAFLDVNPVSHGHSLVVPKQHADTLTDLDPSAVDALFEAVQTVVQRVEDELDPAGVNVLQNNGRMAGQEVPHVHVHVVPRYNDDGVTIAFDQSELQQDVAEELVARLGSH